MANHPHSPAHHLDEAGAYIVTSGTYRKLHHFKSPERLTLLRDALLQAVELHGWQLQAWAVMSNHYHFVALSPPDPRSLPRMIAQLHFDTAREVNRLDGTAGRQVWHQYRETHLTFPRSYYARLNYVHQNPVHHGLVRVASTYPWCSAAWFESTADKPFFRTVSSFRWDRLDVPDDFQIEAF